MPENDVVLSPATTQSPPWVDFSLFFSESLFNLEHDGICYTFKNWLFWHFQALDNDIIKTKSANIFLNKSAVYRLVACH